MSVFKNGLRDFVNWITVLASPTEVFAAQQGDVHWKVAAVCTFSVFVGTSLLMLPLELRVMSNFIASSYGGDPAAYTSPSMNRWAVVVLSWRGGLEILRWLVVSASVYVLQIGFSGRNEISFPAAFSLTVHAESANALMRILSTMYAYSRDLSAIEHPRDLMLPANLSAFGWGGGGPTLRLIASELGVASVWYVVIATYGISVLSGLNKGRSAVIATLGWLVWIGSSMIPAWLFQAIASQ